MGRIRYNFSSSAAVLADVKNSMEQSLPMQEQIIPGVFREVTQLGTELEELGDQILGTANPADVGILFDWDNYWALNLQADPIKI